MHKSQKFPITVKAGATAIKIYSSPLKFGGDGTSKKKGVSYDSFILSYYRGGNRHRQRFNSLEAARTEADCIRALLLNGDSAAMQLTGKDLLTYTQASQVAISLGLSLDMLAKEFAAARQILGSVSLLEAADRAQLSGPRMC